MIKSQVLQQLKNRLNAIDPSAKAFLFGSMARGTEHKGSDWDILILLDKPKITLDDYNRYSYPLREFGWSINEIINPILFTEKEWKENHYSLFNHNVQRDRIAL